MAPGHPRTPKRAHHVIAAMLLAAATFCAALLYLGPSPVQARATGETTSSERGAEDKACARCHAAIVASYAQTSMARASGDALEGLVTGEFTHPDSGVHYSVFARDGQAWLHFARASGTPFAGDRQLRYYIGSNKRGRTYLYADTLDADTLVPRQESTLHGRSADAADAPHSATKLWFEAPINWYAKRAVWDMAPAYEHSASAPLALPVDNNCLHCHASAVAQPLASARNAYTSEPFQQPGIGCAACHGDARAHVASSGKAAILNPDKLTPMRRDSVCLQCHLEGDAVVYRAGESLARFVPGDDIGTFATYFVNASSTTSQRRATSQYEALLRSACKRAAGDALTCTTCHDPHRDPPAAERVAFYRAKCLSCHTSPALAATHHPEQPNCATCHMPTRVASDISHEQMTDHDVERVPAKAPVPRSSEAAPVALVPVGAWVVSDRERGLAYAQFAARGDRASGERATALLLAAAAKPEAFSDAPLHEQLGYLLQLGGDTSGATREYRAALSADPHDATSATNLAVLAASAGHVAEALPLLQRVSADDPTQTTALLDLAAIDCGIGRPAEARATLERALRFNPDNEAARVFLRTGNYAGMRCHLPASEPAQP